MKKLTLFILMCISSFGWAQSISDKLIQVNDAKLNIKAAIASKSVDMAGIPFTDYHLSIASITTGGAAEGDALVTDVLSGKTFSNDTESGITGTMPDNGAVTITPGVATQSIALGYHNGSGIIKAVSALNVYDYNIASGVEILGVTGTLQPIASISYSTITQVQLATAGVAGDLFMSEGFISEVGQPLVTSAPDNNPGANGLSAVMSADGQYLAVPFFASPYLITYKWSELNNRYEKTTVQDVNPVGNSYGCAMSTDGQYLAVAHISSPYLTTYKWNELNNRYEKTAVQDVSPTGHSYAAAMSTDGQRLTVAHITSPYFTSYNWSEANNRYETTVAQNSNPAGAGIGAALSNDGTYLAIACTPSPYLKTYKWSALNSRYEATSAPDADPTGEGRGAAMSADGQYLAITHYSSPYLTTYKWSELNGRYEKTAMQDTNPTGNAYGATMTGDGQYLAVAHDTLPYLTSYKWSSANNRYEKTAVQDVNPPGNGRGVAVSADGSFLAATSLTSTYLRTYKIATTEIFKPAIPLTSGAGYTSIPFNARMIGALLESGSASDTVDFAQIWRRN